MILHVFVFEILHTFVFGDAPRMEEDVFKPSYFTSLLSSAREKRSQTSGGQVNKCRNHSNLISLRKYKRNSQSGTIFIAQRELVCFDPRQRRKNRPNMVNVR